MNDKIALYRRALTNKRERGVISYTQATAIFYIEKRLRDIASMRRTALARATFEHVVLNRPDAAQLVGALYSMGQTELAESVKDIIHMSACAKLPRMGDTPRAWYDRYIALRESDSEKEANKKAMCATVRMWTALEYETLD